MSTKSLAFVFLCVALVACASGDSWVLRKLSQDPITRQLQMAFVLPKYSSHDLSINDIILRKTREMVPCDDNSCCPRHYHHCCESGTRCCDFTGRRSTTYSCY